MKSIMFEELRVFLVAERVNLKYKPKTEIINGSYSFDTSLADRLVAWLFDHMRDKVVFIQFFNSVLFFVCVLLRSTPLDELIISIKSSKLILQNIESR